METLAYILQDEGTELTKEFRKASKLGKGTSQEIAEFRENAFRNFISRFYPLPYRVVKGKIHDSYGNGPSASIDCVLVNPAHPHLIDSLGKFQLLLADGIDFVIEVKPNLSSKDELHRGLEQAISVKKLLRHNSPILSIKSKPAHVIEESRRIPFLLFAETTRTEIVDTVRDAVAYYNSNSIVSQHQLDAIAILGVGILRNLKHADFWPYGSYDVPLSERQGWFLETWNEATLVGLLHCLDSFFPSHPTLLEPVLRHYLSSITIPEIRKIRV